MNKVKKYEEIRYHIEVDHKPGTFNNDMDFVSKDAHATYEYLQRVKEKYHGKKIKITKITDITICEPLSESELEKIANEPNEH